MSLSSLQVLAEKAKRDVLLLAEIGALFHDWQKCIDMAVASHWQRNPKLQQKAAEWKQRSKILKPSALSVLLSQLVINAQFKPLDLKTLCEEGRNPSSASSHSDDRVRLLGACHSIAHVEKELGENEHQESACDRISTAFGYEYLEPASLFDRLLLCTQHYLADNDEVVRSRQQLSNALRQVFLEAWGDTRRPINEVTLWDWSFAVASLFKSELARHFLTGEWRTRSQLRWRLLRVNFDVLGLYARAVKIADFLGYRERIDRACDAVKRLIEEEYPLGNEVYRDTSGIYFTFPDISLPADLAQEIRRRVEEIEMELAPRIAVRGALGGTAAEQLRRILADQRAEAHRELAQPFAPENLNPCWQAEWENLPNGRWEVCPVCRLRPMEEHVDACKHCLGRRKSRIQWWLQNPARTIWMDEIADHNGRVALIVGKIGLDDWLSGDLVQTLLVRAKENAPDECVPKNPSPARLRRVWETTQRFWTETVEERILAKHSYAEGTASDLRRARLFVIPDKKSGWQENLPYDGTVNGRVISLLWREKENSFITISNLQLVAGDAEDVNELAAKLKGQRIVVNDPCKPRQLISFDVRESRDAAGDANGIGAYVPYLGLLASPDQFLALVPAYDALAIAEAIYNEYGRQFGKVQNRLPLFLGLVFFPRKMPLAAVIDTARRMLEQVKFQEETWQIETVNDGRVRFTNGAEWNVPTTMGDGSFDAWYPYFFVSEDKPSYKRLFQVPEGKYKDQWLVHVTELQGREVRVQPSRFAYIYLGHAAQRFTLDADRDALPLDELPRLRQMWDKLKHSDITDTRLRGLETLLEAKRAVWGEGSQELRHLAETALQQAGLSDVISVDDVISGRLHCCLELHLHILKQRVKEEKNERRQKTTTA